MNSTDIVDLCREVASLNSRFLTTEEYPPESWDCAEMEVHPSGTVEGRYLVEVYLENYTLVCNISLIYWEDQDKFQDLEVDIHFQM